jgi:hypothetical protein
MRDRVSLAGPGSHLSASELIDSRKRVEGIPVDALVILESLLQMAEKGNQLAGMLYAEMREDLGITPRRHFGP